MTTSNRPVLTSALLAFSSVLSTTLIIPSVRPFMAARAPASESFAHAFVAASLLGAVLAAPLAGRLVRRAPSTALLATTLALLDAAALWATAAAPGASTILALRFVHGALNVSLVSILIGAARVSAGRRPGSSYGMLGAAMMLGVALGSPLGSLALRFGPTGPLLCAGALELLVALGLRYAELQPVEAEAASNQPYPRLPVVWVFTERAAIGLFVVTFALHGRHCLGLSDARVGLCFSAFMLPFVAAVHPAGWLCDRVGAKALAMGGLVLYGAGWLSLSLAGHAQLIPVLVTLGLSSAAIFAGAMREAGGARSVTDRIRAMSALNSAGSLGMLIGTSAAGIASSVLRARGVAPDTVHAAVFAAAGVLQFAAAASTAAQVLVRGRNVRLVRS